MNNAISYARIASTDDFQTRKGRVCSLYRKCLNTARLRNFEESRFNQAYQITQEQSFMEASFFLFLVMSKKRKKYLSNLASFCLFSESHYRSLREAIILQCWPPPDSTYIKYDPLSPERCHTFNPRFSAIIDLVLSNLRQTRTSRKYGNVKRYNCPYFNSSYGRVIQREHKTPCIRRRWVYCSNPTEDLGGSKRSNCFRIRIPKSTDFGHNHDIFDFILAYLNNIVPRDYSKLQAWQICKDGLLAGRMQVKHQLNNLIRSYRKKVTLSIAPQRIRDIFKQNFETANYQRDLVSVQINRQSDRKKILTFKSKLRHRFSIHLPSLLTQRYRLNKLYLAT